MMKTALKKKRNNRLRKVLQAKKRNHEQAFQTYCTGNCCIGMPCNCGLSGGLK